MYLAFVDDDRTLWAGVSAGGARGTWAAGGQASFRRQTGNALLFRYCSADHHQFHVAPLAAVPALFADAAGSVSSKGDNIRWYAMPYWDSEASSAA